MGCMGENFFLGIFCPLFGSPSVQMSHVHDPKGLAKAARAESKVGGGAL